MTREEKRAVKRAMAKAKDMAVDKAEDAEHRLSMEAKARYFHKVMELEKCDFDRAVELAQGKSDPIQPEYTLGYKLCDPMLNIGLWKSGKRQSEKWAEHFKKSLTPEELAIFEAECMTDETKKQYRKSLKRRGRKVKA